MAGQPDKPQAVKTTKYRVVNALVIYAAAHDEAIRLSGRFGEVIDLSAAEAERLQAFGAIKPADEARSYDEMYVDELEALAAERDLGVRGTGANGHVLKADLVAALEADDGGSPS